MKKEEAPKSFADLLDPKWAGKIVKAHPAYSGTIMNATFQIARDLGWDYFEKLAKQRVMQVQSATDPPKKLALGERAVMADGGEYNRIPRRKKASRSRSSIRRRARRSIVGPNARIQEGAQSECRAAVPELIASRPRPAAHHRLSAACARRIADQGESPAASRSARSRQMKEDPARVEKLSEEIKTRYTQLFRV